LKAEIDSARFGSAYATILANSGLDRHLIDHHDNSSPRANSIRRELLRLVRGFGSNQLLFTGFPTDATWRRIAMEPPDLLKLKYANCPPWLELSRHTRFVTDGAKSIATGTAVEEAAVNIRAVVGDLKRGKRYPELIGVHDQTGCIILMEGHTRATAYAVSQLPERIECLVGSSPSMKTWAFY
jgi:hypothetical protein